ncbi:unnamed protein product [Aphis gossypii]|uniref:Uncharacterized protein n=1 Tax=Aphis gossypii TaxID=80765 RepID=A0A9P0IZU1_APHGO|nr:unnamed protein product [Aphis gossypii]
MDLSNLIVIIQDHQKLTKKIHDIFDEMRPIILFQLLSESILMSLIPLVLFLNSNNGISLTSTESIKLLSAEIANTGHLFSACYLFSLIDIYNDTINFALYNCNWTEMNINFKKLLLFTMQMNNANNFKLNISTNIIVNLKLFTNLKFAVASYKTYAN